MPLLRPAAVQQRVATLRVGEDPLPHRRLVAAIAAAAAAAASGAERPQRLRRVPLRRSLRHRAARAGGGPARALLGARLPRRLGLERRRPPRVRHQPRRQRLRSEDLVAQLTQPQQRRRPRRIVVLSVGAQTHHLRRMAVGRARAHCALAACAVGVGVIGVGVALRVPCERRRRSGRLGARGELRIGRRLRR